MTSPQKSNDIYFRNVLFVSRESLRSSLLCSKGGKLGSIFLERMSVKKFGHTFKQHCVGFLLFWKSLSGDKSVVNIFTCSAGCCVFEKEKLLLM